MIYVFKIEHKFAIIVVYRFKYINQFTLNPVLVSQSRCNTKTGQKTMRPVPIKVFINI